MHVALAAVTSRGLVRQTNQDAVLALTGATRGLYVLAVADGVGGLLNGAEASHLVIEKIAETATHQKVKLADALCAELERANTEVFDSGTARGLPSATTIVLAVVEGSQFEVIHAGDSRAYLCRDGDLLRLTIDHSWVAEQERAGLLTPAEAAASQYRNIITRCIGADPTVQLERQPPQSWRNGDVLLLCSDGLHGLVADDEIRTMLSSDLPVDQLANSLAERANEGGGTDNISVVIARFN